MGLKKNSDTKDNNRRETNMISTIFVFIFYAIIIILSTSFGYFEGRKNNMLILSLTAGFCLSTVFCIILWITSVQKMNIFCINS